MKCSKRILCYLMMSASSFTSGFSFMMLIVQKNYDMIEVIFLATLMTLLIILLTIEAESEAEKKWKKKWKKKRNLDKELEENLEEELEEEN